MRRSYLLPVRSLILLAGATCLAAGLALFPSSCPEPPVMERFDIERFSGLWYEIQRTFALVEGGLRCATTIVSNAHNRKMRATFRRSGINILNRRVTLMRGYLHTPETVQPARLELVMGPLQLFLRYRVIDTNYDDYAVVWGCFESPRYSQILGHTEYILKVGSSLMLNGIELKIMEELKLNNSLKEVLHCCEDDSLQSWWSNKGSSLQAREEPVELREYWLVRRITENRITSKNK